MQHIWHHWPRSLLPMWLGWLNVMHNSKDRSFRDEHNEIARPSTRQWKGPCRLLTWWIDVTLMCERVVHFDHSRAPQSSDVNLAQFWEGMAEPFISITQASH